MSDGSGPSVDELPRMPRRRRLLVLLLAVSTACTVMWLMLAHPGGAKLAKTAEAPNAGSPPDTARCPSQAPDAASSTQAGAAPPEACVGAVTRVLPPASR